MSLSQETSGDFEKNSHIVEGGNTGFIETFLFFLGVYLLSYSNLYLSLLRSSVAVHATPLLGCQIHIARNV